MNRFITLLLLGVVASAMLLMFFVHMNSGGGSPASPVPSSQETASQETASRDAPQPRPAALEAPPVPAPPPAPAQPEAEAPATPPAPAPAPAPLPTEQTPNTAPAPAPTPAPAPPAPPAPPAAPPQPQAASRAEGSGKILDISLHFREPGMFLRIDGDGPLPARYFILSEPERLVIDLPGSWQGIKSPVVPGNNIVKNVRLGRQGGADRLVLDLASPLKRHELRRVNDHEVEIYFEQ